MASNDNRWGKLARIDTLLSLGLGLATLWSGVLDSTPWPIRIAAGVTAAAGGLWLWRNLAFRRLIEPNKIQSVYENDVLDLNELFQGRSFIRGVTFRRSEIRGPGSMVLLRPIMRSNTFNPDLETLLVVVPPSTNLLPHPQFIDCVFEECYFTGCGLIAVPEFADWLRQSCGQLLSPVVSLDAIEGVDLKPGKTGRRGKGAR